MTTSPLSEAVAWLEDDRNNGMRDSNYQHRGELYVRPMFQEESAIMGGGSYSTLGPMCSCYDPAYSLDYRKKSHKNCAEPRYLASDWEYGTGETTEVYNRIASERRYYQPWRSPER